MTGDASTASALSSSFPLVTGKAPRHLGYIVNFSFHVWYKVLERYLRLRAAEYGIPKVAVVDARLDLQTQLDALDSLVADGVDALIVTPVPGPGTEEIVAKAAAAHLPLVIEANPVKGMSTLVAICDYDAGWKAGAWAGRYLASHQTTRAVVLDIAYPPLRPCLLRSEGFLDGLRSILPDTTLRERVNGEARVDISRSLAGRVMAQYPDINVVFGMDDESIQGAVDYLESTGRDVEDKVLIGFGLAGDTDKERLAGQRHLKASLAMFPEWVGVRCVDQAVRLCNGHAVQVHDIAPTIPVSGATLPKYYQNTPEGWMPDFAAINAIPRERLCSRV